MDSQFSSEAQYLEKVKQIASEQIALLEHEVGEGEKDILQAKKEMREETSHSIADLWGSDAFEQLAELSQFATQISFDITNNESKIKSIEKLKKMLLSPYFARVDFTFPNTDAPRSIYIGRSSLKKGNKIMVHDWRAPVSSLFYRFTLGPASYVAPSGTISGDISLKRQFEITDGQLDFYFDADIEILDEYLRKMLSQNATPQMKSIVETIQREQDIVIRDASHDVLIVQGVAGSGKTSIAMHRAAYLMYKGLTDRLSSANILILSPNSVFETYISNILPELGEENIASYILDELYEIVLDTPHIQTRYQLLEELMLNEGYWVPVMKRSMEFKCSDVFGQILDRMQIDGQEVASILEQYNRLFNKNGYLKQLANTAGVSLPDDIESIMQFTKENLQSEKLFFDDATALTYLYLSHTEYEEYNYIRQVVIDEAQDYYPLHYKILAMLFPNAKFTILGDIAQTIEKPEGIDFYDTIIKALNKRKNSLVVLEKSFRCTNEIIQFSSYIIGTNIQSFGRDGEKPGIAKVTEQTKYDMLVQDIQSGIDAGYESVGIICKSEKDCKQLYDAIKDKVDVSLIDGASEARLSGIFILPVYLSKGLEFDAAFLWDVDEAHYHSESDRSLLFIGCTRALHQLKLYYCDIRSPLLSFENLKGPR